MKKQTNILKQIQFVKDVASDYGISLTDTEAKKAIKITKCDYYRLKEYFNN